MDWPATLQQLRRDDRECPYQKTGKEDSAPSSRKKSSQPMKPRYPQPSKKPDGRVMNPALREFIRALAYQMADEDYDRMMAAAGQTRPDSVIGQK